MYLSLPSHAKHLLKSRGIQMLTFSAFLTVSSFTNCAFVPTNENMIAFKKDTPSSLVNYPSTSTGKHSLPFLFDACYLLSEKVDMREEFGYLVENYQFVVFCWLQWNSEAFSEFGNGEKVDAGLFLSVNLRYSGESVVDLSLLKPALQTCFPRRVHKRSENQQEKGRKFLRGNLIFFGIYACSTYGNVGFSMGYCCQKLHKLSNESCKNVSYSFFGKWSKKGKLVIIFVMFYRKLEKFTVKEGKTWLTL
ncbi:hypothetical protein AMTRI_Chr01g113980 [Amborella trichopoda]